METQLIEADERLARVFSHLYIARQPANAPTIRQQLLPNYEMLLAFNFGPNLPVSLGNTAYLVRHTAIIGPLQKLLQYELRAGADLIVVVFTLNGFYRLFGKLLQQTGDTVADLSADPDFLDGLWVQLAALSTTDARVQYVSEYALTHLSPTDDTMQPLLDTIPHFRHTSVDPIKAVAEQHNLSTRTVQLRFQRQLGYSAKEMIRFVRFKHLIAQLMGQPSASPDWAELVYAYGYHDQSHLIRDFKHYTGLSPGAFVKQLLRQEMCISQPGKFY